MTAPSPNGWDEDALADDIREFQDTFTDDDFAVMANASSHHADHEGCSSPEIADTGGALVGCLGWAALVFALFVAWVIYESVREAPPRHPPFSELPDDPAGGGR